MTFLEAIVLAVIEGLTEFLPVSSTGHIILGSAFMGIQSTPFVKLFTVAIQLGTILSVLVLYWKRFLKTMDFYYKLLVAFIPSAIFGLLLSDKIDAMMESPQTVAISLVIGGVILLFVDKWFKRVRYDDADKVDYLTAIKIGFFQCLAMIPGTSRSGATIVGGMSQRLSRKAAAEFSFFLAVPTMFAATAKKLLDFIMDGNALTGQEIQVLAIGNIVGFIVAIVAIKSFIGFLTKHGFFWFGVYRIIAGLTILGLIFAGYELKIV